MFNIKDKSGNIVDTATCFAQAMSVVTYHDTHDKASGPHTSVAV